MKRIVVAAAVIFAVFCSVCSAQSDIDTHWSKKYFETLCENGIISGDGQGNFMPERNITRAEFVVAVVRSINESGSREKSFGDIDDASFYAPYVNRASELGIVSGYADGSFRPNKSLTREEAVVILSRAFGFLSGYTIGNAFADTHDITPAAKGAFAYAYRKEIISGYPDNTLRPQASITRAEAVVMLSASQALGSNEPGFIVGYPRLAKSGIYGCIRLEVSTNMPCSVYYALYDSGMPGYPSKSSIDKPLAVVTAGRVKLTEDIVCDVGREYDVFLMAVTPEGKTSKIVKIENTAALPFTEGDGTKQSPYGIYNAMQLNAVRYVPECSFALKQDIELSGEWKPIESFSGTFNGEGHTISGLSVKNNNDCAGMFAKTDGAVIENLTIDGSVEAKSSAGIFAGELVGGEIRNCAAVGRVHAETNNAGGIAGENGGRIENCLSAVYLVEASAFAGGIAGQNYSLITDSISAAHTVSADMYAGGIAAVNSAGKIENSVAACTNVFDVMLHNCGRIAINKKGGTLFGNYAYDKMKTTSELAQNSTDNQNGGDIDWEELIDIKKLCTKLGWDSAAWRGGGRANRFLIPYPRGAAEPRQTAGIGAYTPIRVSSAAELLGMIDNTSMHYLLVNDIYFDADTVWTIAADTDDEEAGFSGSLDGGGYCIHNIALSPSETGKTGIFGMISGGSVRNLRISGARAEAQKMCGVIAAVNYGSVTGCSVDAKITAPGEGVVYAGGAVGQNFGEITDCEVNINIDSDARNITAGAIAAHNEGFINNTASGGEIVTKRTVSTSESVAGGVCGYNAGGMIYNSYSDVKLRQLATTLYGGGICAIQTVGEIYKCASKGGIINEPPSRTMSTAYTGGVCALVSGGLVMHSFSASDINVYSVKSYAGGVCGYLESGMIQNVYSVNPVVQAAELSFDDELCSYVGGICGYNEAGTIASSAAVNPAIKSVKDAGKICGGGDAESLYSNYSLSGMSVEGKENTELSGTELSGARLSGAEFFTRPLEEGGLLGWSEEVWSASPSRYVLPVLKNVKYQNTFAASVSMK